jgi:hypothetical protein
MHNEHEEPAIQDGSFCTPLVEPEPNVDNVNTTLRMMGQAIMEMQRQLFYMQESLLRNPTQTSNLKTEASPFHGVPQCQSKTEASPFHGVPQCQSIPETPPINQQPVVQQGPGINSQSN